MVKSYKYKVVVKGITISKHQKKITALKKASSIKTAVVLPLRPKKTLIKKRKKTTTRKKNSWF